MQHLKNFFNRLFSSGNDPESVANYYDQWTERYLEVYGEVIQAFRPENDAELLDYLIESAGIQDGMKILDAGCGVCGPASHFAKARQVNISALTISAEQVQIGAEKVQREGLSDQIEVKRGDFHEIDQIYAPESFDQVLFLEALGHSDRPEIAIAAAYKVLRPGGSIYIKDFFPRKSRSEKLNRRINQVVNQINKAYTYNVLDFDTTVSALRFEGFEIDYIRKFRFANHIEIRSKFESQFDIDLYEGESEFVPAEWLEIRCEKIFYSENQKIVQT